MYHEKVQTSKVFVRDASPAPPYALLLFGGAVTVRHADSRVLVDDWIRFEAPARVAVLVKELRREVDAALEAKFEQPEDEAWAGEVGDVLCRLLVGGGLV